VSVVFADTSFFIALLDGDDEFHAAACAFAAANRAPLMTTSAVILELGVYFSQVPLRAGFLACLATIRRAAITIVHVDEDLQERGVERFEQRLDKGWSLADSISFILMERQNCWEAATSDQHFEQAGFRALLRPAASE
jgi:predicted nucleic acid-binding protein